MVKSELANRIKALRNQKGMSQEFLADEAGLSLRTIQRIENSESSPTGDTLKRLSKALNTSPDELIDWTIKEDKRYLNFLNLSALTFLFFPLLGILVPFILWTSKKGKIKNLDNLGRTLINFQITWNIALFFIPLLVFITSSIGLFNNVTLSMLFIYIAILYAYNTILITINSIRISNTFPVKYFPKIHFLR